MGWIAYVFIAILAFFVWQLLSSDLEPYGPDNPAPIEKHEDVSNPSNDWEKSD